MSGGSSLKIKFKEDKNLPCDEIIITASALTSEIETLIKDLRKTSIKAIHRDSDIILSSDEILFFETDMNVIYAHTKNDSFETRYKLYELENVLSQSFTRISKSTIVNIKEISSIDRGLTSSRKVSFFNSVKVVYVSRMYYPILKQKLDERSL